ncbi:flagellar hook protein FlgE [Noviherbaspirillum massiliense]|uniref:flagellar hook protein FlgE n=1 Tax=Noviherbaspirillum massiliense TaxID=1465823 RepID=UPI0003141EBC|nr:flagellar hook protein FlgE [Noviherbaspirillum massiliense]
MSFQQGLSGLNAASKNLEVIGNNVANANTVGFKGSQAQFADIYASSLNGGGTSQVGIGTKVTQIAQQFSQGNITSSSNPLDIAINGGGFFGMNDNGTVYFTRNGQFTLDKSGYIVNSQGLRLSGYNLNANGVPSGQIVDLQIPSAAMPPQATSTITTAVNLQTGAKPPTVSPFNPDDPLTYNNSTSIITYDSKGDSHQLQLYYVKTATDWHVYAADDTVQPPPTPRPSMDLGALTFNTDGSLATPSPGQLTVPAINIPGVDPLNITINIAGTTEYGSSFDVRTLTQNGYVDGNLSSFTVDGNGIVLGRYSNGQTRSLGQVALFSFPNPNGLQPMGNNLWAPTAASDVAVAGQPGTGKLGTLQASAVEDSNVDLTAELVNMITAQRVYQANAQTIKTQDQLMQTLVNLR